MPVIIFRVIAILIFIVSLFVGALNQLTVTECLFATTLMLCATAMIGLFTRRIIFSLLFVATLFAALQFVSKFKYHYLRNSLIINDFLYFNILATLDTFSHYPELQYLSFGILLLILFLIAIFISEKASLFASCSRRQRNLNQWGGGIFSVLLFLLLNSNHGPFGQIFQKSWWDITNDHSHLANFFISAHNMQIELPQIKNGTADNYKWQSQPAQAAIERPDIVAVLEESTFDPRLLKACTISQCHRAMFDADDTTRTHGLLKVHTFGGATWTSEFAWLTGMPHVLFGVAGMYAPYNLAPRITDSLPQLMRTLGYRTVAVYPLYADFINAKNAYQAYGFDRFYDATELGLTWGSSDLDLAQAFDRVWKQEQTHKQPLFIFALTLYQGVGA